MALSSKKSQILYLAVTLVLLPVLAESIYSPTLPDLARDFSVSNELAENTLSIYLLGAGLGPLLIGSLSDSFGRRRVALVGYTVFLLATLWCALTTNFWIFMFGRLLQGFSGAVSCLCQCVLRDVYDQKERIEASSVVGLVVSVAPALGALLGGIIADLSGWRTAFYVLLFVGMVLFLRIAFMLPETAKNLSPWRLSTLRNGFTKVVQDPNLLGHSAMIGLGLGICFAFFAEAPFYFIQTLGMTPSWFGVVCAAGAVVYGVGCRVANRFIQSGTEYTLIMRLGVMLMMSSFSLFVIAVMLFTGAQAIMQLSNSNLCVLFTFFWMFSQLGLSFVLTPSFALALENQAKAAGVAASWFSFIYNMMNMLICALMAFLHNASLLTMPVYFLVISMCMAVVLRLALDKKWLDAHNVAKYS